ncbi:hypothetical protein Taro_039732, partial [Colocasia esculenta]|nr:hypothetical protein [Colocasia esculenta]
MTTGGSSSDVGGDGGGNGGGGGGGGDGGQGGGDGDSGQGGGGGGMAFTEEQFYRGATQDSSHGAPLRYNRRQKFRPGSQARGSPVDSHSYDTMISDFERMSTQESVGSYGGHSYHPESTSTDYSSGYRPYSEYTATAGYLGPSPYMYPPPAFSVPVPVQVFAPLEDVQMAQLNIVHPVSQSWPTSLLDNPSVGELACDLLLFFFFVRGVDDEGIYPHFYFRSRLRLFALKDYDFIKAGRAWLLAGRDVFVQRDALGEAGKTLAGSWSRCFVWRWAENVHVRHGPLGYARGPAPYLEIDFRGTAPRPCPL